VLLVNCVHMLTNVIMANLIQVDLVWWTVLSCGLAMIVVTHLKDGVYHDWFLANMFFHLIIEVFICLH
jgi:hypothetical protein